jgi:hypothetical protein
LNGVRLTIEMMRPSTTPCSACIAVSLRAANAAIARPEADGRGAIRERREISLSTPPGVPYPGKMVVHNDGSLPRRLEPPFMKVKFAAKTRLQAGT